MFHSHQKNILAPLICKAKKELENKNPESTKTLIILNSNLVKFNPRIVSSVDPYYSDEEEKQALELLKSNGFACTAKLSPRCRRDILLDLGRQYKKLTELS
jgi:hypothetical protein